MEEVMFVAVVRFSPVPAGGEAVLQEWFAWSNGRLRDAPGLRSRRLLRADDGTYLALVEHESAAGFKEMHAGPVAREVHARLHRVLDVEPRPEFYEVVEDAAAGCCGGHQDAPIAGSHVEVAEDVKGGCCSA